MTKGGFEKKKGQEKEDRGKTEPAYPPLFHLDQLSNKTPEHLNGDVTRHKVNFARFENTRRLATKSLHQCPFFKKTEHLQAPNKESTAPGIWYYHPETISAWVKGGKQESRKPNKPK